MERSRTSFTWDPAPFSPETESPPLSDGLESIDDLARRVLHSPILEEKLRPHLLSSADESPPLAPARESWSGFVPARPESLRFAKESEARPGLPTRPSLVDDENRGVLLHFFANHELLAAELMALALLKFPEAPAAFRRGLAETLREEQRHTRWYLARMRECGVEFGQYPVSPYFWDSVSTMESPLDYVSRLSLTFEQANLDYARHYSGVLAEAGDAKSASILRRIYEDEITHVGYGLHWFRQWKAPGESDWTALARQLPFPLSPSRAKGNRSAFNEEGRRAAGFDEDYIRRLTLFERSKGRTPNVFYFNPEAEHRAARWPAAYHPDKARLAVLGDLEVLVGFLARRDDVLLLRRAPAENHLAKLARCGLGLPEIEVLAPDGSVDPDGLLARRKLNALRPWAIAPDLPQHFRRLETAGKDGLTRHEWTPEIRGLFSKVEQARALPRWMGPSFPCFSPEELFAAAQSLEESGYHTWLIKRAFSTAGSGNTPLSSDDLDSLAGRPFRDSLFAEGGVLLEPRHDRVFDFSVQYRIEDGHIRLVGLVEQVVTSGGGYRGSICRSKFCRSLPPELARFLMEQCLPLYAADGDLALDLAEWAGSRGYEGPLGIDAYVFREPNGLLALRPFCEINPRNTMGLVALELKRRVSPGHDIAFAINKASDLTPEDDDPGIDSSGRLCGKSLTLTEILPGTQFAAVLRVIS